MPKTLSLEEFKQFLADNLKGKEVDFQEIHKNNQTLTGMILNLGNLRPTIYVELLYEDYKRGACLKELIDYVNDVYERSNDQEIVLRETISKIHSFKDMKERIIPVLIKKAGNEAMLDKLPHKELLDLAVIYKVQLTEEASVNVTEQLITLWKQNIDTVHEVALQNQSDSLKFENLIEVLMKIIKTNGRFEGKMDFLLSLLRETEENKLFFLSNSSSLYGAAAMLDENMMKSIHQKIGDFYVIPSSIHEILVLPDLKEEGQREALVSMVQEVNDTQLSPQDLLSYSVYLYTEEGLKIA